jgi:hypothetical protein
VPILLSQRASHRIHTHSFPCLWVSCITVSSATCIVSSAGAALSCFTRYGHIFDVRSPAQSHPTTRPPGVRGWWHAPPSSRHLRSLLSECVGVRSCVCLWGCSSCVYVYVRPVLYKVNSGSGSGDIKKKKKKIGFIYSYCRALRNPTVKK